MRRIDAHIRAVALWDETWCVRLNHAAAVPWLCAVFRVVSRLGNGIFWYALMAALLAVGQSSALPAVAHMAIVAALGVALYKWLKQRTSRPRPYQVHAAIHHAADPLDRYSFPSGHTLHAFAFSIVSVAYYPTLAWLVIPFTLAVAASRLVLGLHYPTDVLAGAAIGAVLATASFAMF